MIGRQQSKENNLNLERSLYQSVNVESLDTIQGEFADSKDKTLLLDRNQFQSKLSNIKVHKNDNNDFNDRDTNPNFRQNADLSALSQDLNMVTQS